MSLHVEYDAAKLKEMSTRDVMLQVCARLDLRTPNREHDLKASLLKAKLLAEATTYLEEVRKLNIPLLAEAIEAAIAAYEGGEA